LKLGTNVVCGVGFSTIGVKPHFDPAGKDKPLGANGLKAVVVGVPEEH